MSLNFHEFNTNSQKFYPENLDFQDKGFYMKIFYDRNLEPFGIPNVLHCTMTVLLEYNGIVLA